MIWVLRLGHRLPRDERMTTHIALVARAFLANKMFYSGQKDKGMEESVNKIVKNWGGKFEVGYLKNPFSFLKKNRTKFKIIHLTMYGIPLLEKIEDIKKEKNFIIVVGSEKVPKEIYEIADYNIAITSQPHSEVAALAITLNEILGKKPIKEDLFKGKIKIIPSEKGKKVVRNKS